MLLVNENCECCGLNKVHISEPSSEPGYFFKLCNSCFSSLTNHALRPREFFNLATIHSIDNPYLDDDFYDWETGKALQPSKKITNANKFPFPFMDALKDDYKNLIDLACIQFEIDSEIVTLLKKIEKKKILEYLDFKVVYNRSINYYAYKIAARVLGNSAEEWMREQWIAHKPGELFVFAEALNACLPFGNAFEIITNELQEGGDSEMAKNISVLCYFESSATLRWIESIKYRITNIGIDWGVVAAASKFDWATTKRWLVIGRPLSLIALDALIFCTTKGNKQNQSIWLIKHPPILNDQPSMKEISASLNEYLVRDNVPRTKNAVKKIMENLHST